MDFEAESQRAARIWHSKSFIDRIPPFFGYLALGAFIGSVLGIAIGNSMSLIPDLLVVAVMVSIVATVRHLLASERYYTSLVFLSGFLVFAIYLGAISSVFTNDRYATKAPALVDNCEELRWDMTCTWVSPLSRLLAAVRCGEVSLLWVQQQELKPRYQDLHQQCYGG